MEPSQAAGKRILGPSGGATARALAGAAGTSELPHAWESSRIPFQLLGDSARQARAPQASLGPLQLPREFLGIAMSAVGLPGSPKSASGPPGLFFTPLGSQGVPQKPLWTPRVPKASSWIPEDSWGFRRGPQGPLGMSLRILRGFLGAPGASAEAPLDSKGSSGIPLGS